MILQQQNIIDKRTRPKFVQGRIVYDATTYDDVVDNGTKFVTSEPILGGQHFYIRVKSGYKLAYVAFYDVGCRKFHIIRGWYNVNGATLEGVDSELLRDNTLQYNKSTKMRTWIPAGAYARVTVCKADVEIHDGVTTGTDMTPSDDFLEVYHTFDHVFMQPSRAVAAPAIHANGMKLARQVSNCYTLSRVATINQNTSDGWVGKEAPNSYCKGIFYSKVSGQRPGSMSMMHPSMETYLSLWHNRRSLLYTERPMTNVSGYGISWVAYDTVATKGRFAYGMVCNTAFATVFGMPEDTFQNIFTNTSLFTVKYSSLSALLSAGDAADLRSYDVCYRSGHVLVITNVFRPSANELYIEAFESSTDCQLRIMTLQSFCEHFTAEGDTFKIVRPKAAFYEMVGRMDYRPTAGASATPRERTLYVPNDDICTFAGDKATFASGDPVWLNVRQTNGGTGATFDSIRLYRLVGDSYSLVQTLTMSQPATAHRKTFTGGDVVWDIEVSSLFADGTLSGLFKATAYNSSTQAESAPTRFEVLNIGLTNAYRVGLTTSSTTHDVIAIMSDSARNGEHDAFIRVLDSHYLVKVNENCTYAHHRVQRHEEGKYGVMLAATMASLDANGYCQLAVKGEYGYAFINKPLTSLTNLLSSSTVNANKYLTVNGNLGSLSGWRTYVKAVGSSQIGKTFTIVYDDRVTPEKYIVVAQYSAADAGSIGAGNLIKKHYVHRMNDGYTRETRMVDVKIEEGCTFIAVSSPLDATGSATVRDMVELPDLVQAEDEGYDMYFGWVDNPIDPSMLQDMTPASLLTYAKGYHRSETAQITKTVTDADLDSNSSNQLFFLMWKDGNQPLSGRMTSSGMATIWNAASFEGSNATGDNWDTDGNKQVTIGGTVYRVSRKWVNLDRGDTIEINF